MKRSLMILPVLFLLTAAAGQLTAYAQNGSGENKIINNDETITLIGAELSYEKITCADNASVCSLTVQGNGKLTVSQGIDLGNNDLTINGQGITLEVTDGGITAGSIEITKGKVTAKNQSGLYGIFAQEDISIDSAEVTASGQAYGIYAQSDNIKIKNSIVTATGDENGIFANHSLEIEGGEVSATASRTAITTGGGSYILDPGTRGIRISGNAKVTAKAEGSLPNVPGIGIRSLGKFDISGGSTVTATGSNAGILAEDGFTVTESTVEASGNYGIWAYRDSISLQKSSIEASGTSGGISAIGGNSNGSVTIEGGQVTANGGIKAGQISLSLTENSEFIYADSYSPNPKTLRDFRAYKGDTPKWIVPKADPVADLNTVDGYTLRLLNGYCVFAHDGLTVSGKAAIKDEDINVYCDDDPQTQGDLLTLIPPIKLGMLSAKTWTDGTQITISPVDYSFTLPEDDVIAELVSLTIDEIPAQTYTGSGIEPAVIVRKGTEALTKDEEYTVTYEQNINAGTNTASAVVTGKGLYTGTEIVNFTIEPKPVTVTADNKNKLEGDADPALTATVNGTLGNDTITYSLTREGDESTGSHPITVTGDVFQGNYFVTFVNGTLIISAKETPERPGIDFFRLYGDCELPATGFSSLQPTVLPEQPKDLRYEPAGMHLMLPTLDREIGLVTMPREGNSWAAARLGTDAGILEGSALPGEGVSIIAGHNTLNDTSFGPFVLLGSLEPNDLIAVAGEDGSLKLFRVYANELLTPDGMQTIEALAGEDGLVLVTCENESADGGYLNRRAVFAK